MKSTPGRIVFANLLADAKALAGSGVWSDFRPGVTAHWLYDDGPTGPSAVFLRYEPGTRVTRHEHTGYEHLFVLEGDQYDEDGSYPAGSFIVHSPGSCHSPGSVGGCLALLLYDKPVRFLDEP